LRQTTALWEWEFFEHAFAAVLRRNQAMRIGVFDASNVAQPAAASWFADPLQSLYCQRDLMQIYARMDSNADPDSSVRL
jgi:hypothetical protein